jgi:raffinose/stachyose/melibiose transport system substrate-binding protein
MRYHKHFLIVLAVTVAFVIGLVPVAAQTDVTLVVWDNWTRDAEQTMIEQLDKQFEDAHPGVTIQREAYSTDDLSLTLPRALTQSTGPDVAMINQGLTNMAALVKAGLLLPLNDYADQYKWWDRYGAGLHARNSVTDDGEHVGSGSLYGMSVTSEVVAMFYNKDIFTKLNLTVPKTWDELQADLEAIKAGGYVPVTFGNLEGWPGIHTYGALAHVYSDIKAVNDMIYRNEGGTFKTEGNLNGAQTFVDWIDKGYLSPGFAGMDNDTGALGEFTSAKSAMWLAGSWNSGSISSVLGEDKVGFFILPSPTGEKVAPTIGGIGLGYGIRKTSSNADLAAQYIDFISSPDAANVLFDNGYLPAIAVDSAKLKEGTLTADLVNAWTTISTADMVGQYFDWTLPDIGPRIQELAGKQVTPEQFVDEVQQDYEAGAK